MPLPKDPVARRRQVFAEFKAGDLHSGRGGPVVKNPKQAVAIALNDEKPKRRKITRK